MNKSYDSALLNSAEDSQFNNINSILLNRNQSGGGGIPREFRDDQQPSMRNESQKESEETLQKSNWVTQFYLISQVPDMKAKQCYKCHKEFTFFYRKHHCRICGNVFCHNCATLEAMTISIHIVKLIENQLKNVRQCETCKRMTNNYLKSLKQKKNLIKGDPRHYFQSETRTSSRGSKNRLTDEGDNSRKTPHFKNLKHQQLLELVKEEENRNPTAQELKEMEEFEMKLTMLDCNLTDKADGIKEYIEKIKQEEEMNNNHSSKTKSSNKEMQDKIIQQRLKDYSQQHIQFMVQDVMKNKNIDSAKWGPKLLEYVNQAVDNVKPSSRMLNDSMKFNSFIKIKIINWVDNSKSAYINGVVMSKNLADKRMQQEFANPTILILEGSLGFELTDISSAIDLEEDQVNILKMKLTSLKPSIIIVEKDVSYKVLDALREAKITVIANLSTHKLKRIARYTQTLICCSPNILSKGNFIPGKCKQFRSERPYTGVQNKMISTSNITGSDSNISVLQNQVSKDKNLIYFDGCNPMLGCTILISGNMASEMDELKKIKEALREMLALARNIVLEKGFLQQINCKVVRPVNDEKQNFNVQETPFLITKKIENRAVFVAYKVYLKRGIDKPIYQHNLSQIEIGDKEHSSIYHPVEYSKIDVEKHKDSKDKVNENYIKNKIDSMCECPSKEKIHFYGKGDETIGQMLKKICRNSKQKCKSCGNEMNKHFIQYYHKEGYIEIQITDLNIIDPLKKVGAQSKNIKEIMGQDIIMKGECQICKKQTVPDTVMSSQFYEYSSWRFIEQFFYNGDKLINNDDFCQHRAMKDIQRIFIMKAGFQITFTYCDLQVYNIEMIEPKSQDTTALWNSLIAKRRRDMEQSVKMAYEDIKRRIQFILDYLKQEKKTYLDQIPTKYIEEEQELKSIIDPLNQLEKRLSEADHELSNLLTKGISPINELDSIFAVFFLERKLLVNFLTFSKALDEITRVMALLIVLLKRRSAVIKSVQFQENQENHLTKEEGGESKEKDPTIKGEGIDNIQKLDKRETLPGALRIAIGDPIVWTSMKANNFLNTELSNAEGGNQSLAKFVDSFLHYTDKVQYLAMLATQNGSPPSNMSKPALGLNFDILKQQIVNNVQTLVDDINKKIQVQQEFILIGKNKKVEEEELKKDVNENKFRAESNAFKDQSANQNELKFGEPLKFKQLNPLNQYQLAWIARLQNGFVSLTQITDNAYIPIKEGDLGSMVSFALASNVYKEAMIRQNYMDSSKLVKNFNKHIGAQVTEQIGNIAVRNAEPLAPMQEELIELQGKNDVFNMELTQSQIQTELLNGERLSFTLKFSTDKDDLSLKIQKNGVTTKIKAGGNIFLTGIDKRKRMSIREDVTQISMTKKKVKVKNYQEICQSVPKNFQEGVFFKKTIEQLDSFLVKLDSIYLKNSKLARGVSPNKLQDKRGGGSAYQSDQVEKNEKAKIKETVLEGEDLSINNEQAPTLRESMGGKIPIQFQTVADKVPAAKDTKQSTSDINDFCGIKNPKYLIDLNSNEALAAELKMSKIDIELKIYFPKKFEALRRFYCGTQYDFIQSLIQTKNWASVSGGKTKSKFYISSDDKYVFKEIKKSEFKMFLEFAPQYFDYLCKSFFHNYPCALCRILGAYKVKTLHKIGQQKVDKKYIYVMENLNYGIRPEDEQHIMRFDLKGSTLNRFVKNKESKENGKAVLHDNNFLFEQQGRPFALKYTLNRILQICINNDTLCLSKSNIVDYSLLAIIDNHRKKVRFGIIDYVQQYTLEKILESKFKKYIKGEPPTIIDPEKYMQRFKRAMKKYFVGMSSQDEKPQKMTDSFDECDSSEQSEQESSDLKLELPSNSVSSVGLRQEEGSQNFE